MNRQNVELKARLPSLAAARRIAAELATEHPGIQRQTDTYFRVPHGRLKLREIEGQPAQLVWYQRPDRPDAKLSDYLLVPVDAPAELKLALAGACGVLVVVRKRREVFLVENVRLHLDEVEALGEFLEFEAVLTAGTTAEDGRRQVVELMRRFAITPEQLIEASYADLLQATATQQS